MKRFELLSHNPSETQQLGMRIGKLALPGDIFLLVGTLGAGKTCFAQGVARGLEIYEYTPSPTFVLVREFYGRLTLYHIDLYRLDRIEEIADLGLDDYLYGSGVCVIEWAEKGLDLMPREYLIVRIDLLGENERRLRFENHGKHYREVVNDFKKGRGG
jgi:tRNA threonylcarbamoyladenosine biosynthesis protein TsaE